VISHRRSTYGFGRAAAVKATAAVPPRVLAVAVPVIAAGAFVFGLAVYEYASAARSADDLAGLFGLFSVMALAERFPVQVEGMGANGVTLGFVFSVSTIILLGWPAGVIVAAGAPAVVHILQHRPPLRIAYNGSMFALSALAAGLAVEHVQGNSPAVLVARVVLCGLIYSGVNLVLISAILAADSERNFFTIARGNVAQTTAPFAFMVSAALTLIVLWQRAPLLVIALVGPLLAIALYQRSTFKAMQAMRLALTDPLTGLGNHRSFHERLQRELVAAEEKRSSLALCLVDFDNLKRINDHFGHPVGDLVLGQVASRLRQGGESFRLGGDEFAVLLPGQDERQATGVARSIVERVARLDVEGVGTVTVSAGVATYPTQGSSRDELIRLADTALYRAKKDGKNRVRAYAAESPLHADLERLAEGPDSAARYRAAASLAKAADERDAFDGSHSQRVGDYSARIAQRLGSDEATVERTRLAGNLHDLGKLAIPEEILRKPTTLSDAERLVLQRHPQIGARMLESLGVEQVAEWVLHHHERWDGAGYPNRLAGDQIPLAARIIFVADAYDAMTSEHSYGERLTEEEAMAELERCAGTQFDPAVVDALALELTPQREPDPVLAS
jgi:diguanylate cyclase (GGDEF)-like protein